ncbi:MAG: hypothetical protein Q8896_04985 [Bacteroidota bacterium]|nr:hypothetical protein [Bacteroidota bacterium]
MQYLTFSRQSNQDTPPPVLVILHGYGADEHDLLPLAQHFDPKLLTVSIQAPITLDWGGYAWYHLTQTAAGLGGDDESRMQSEQLLFDELPKIISEVGGDPTQVYLLGFSQGAAMCYSLLGRHDLSTKGINLLGVIILSGYVPDDVKETLRRKNLSNIPFFLSHGSADPLVPVISMYEALSILEEAGAKTFSKEYEIGHGLTEETVSDVRNWMDKQQTADSWL